MNTARRSRSRPTWILYALLAALGSSTVLAAGKAAPLDPKARYRRDIAACARISDVDQRANCRSEASARFASTQPARAEESPDILMRNALERCEPLPEPYRTDCVARMQGQGMTRGSVAEGIIVRELVTREVGGVPVVVPPAEPAPSAPASAPSASGQ